MLSCCCIGKVKKIENNIITLEDYETGEIYEFCGTGDISLKLSVGDVGGFTGIYTNGKFFLERDDLFSIIDPFYQSDLIKTSENMFATVINDPFPENFKSTLKYSEEKLRKFIEEAKEKEGNSEVES